MFNIRDEGDPIKQGFNFYPLSSDHIGFIFRFEDNCFRIRYSKIRNRFLVSF